MAASVQENVQQEVVRLPESVSKVLDSVQLFLQVQHSLQRNIIDYVDRRACETESKQDIRKDPEENSRPGLEMTVELKMDARMAHLEARVAQIERILEMFGSNDRKEEPLQQGSQQSQQICKSSSLASGSKKEEVADVDFMENLEGRADATATCRDGGEVENARYLQESMWECMLVLGLPGIGCLESCMLLASFFLNVCLQLAFCFIALSFFPSQTRLPSVEDAINWRLTDAHSPTYMDRNSVVTLASRVCQEDATLSIATSQMELLENIRSYNGDLPGVSSWVAGLTLCSMVVFTWSLIVIKEMKDAHEFALVLKALPRSPRTELMKSRDECILASASIARIVALVGVTACRFTVSCVLGYVGMKWLCSTAGITDLVLNAVALAFVLELDELLFGALAPSSVKVVVRVMQPLHGHTPHTWMPLVTLLLCLAFVCASVIQVAVPMSNQMADIEFELCKRGSTEFVVDASTTTGLIVVANTSQFKNDAGVDTTDSWFKFYVKEIIDGNYRRGSLECADELWCSFIWLAPPSDYSRVQDVLTVVGYPFRRDHCYDLLGEDEEYSPTHLRWLHARYPEKKTASSCAGFSSHCDENDAEVVRWLCPTTCGCDNPRSGLWYDHGCPTACLEFRTRYIKHDTPCENVHPKSTPSDFNGLKRWLDGIGPAQVPHDLCENQHSWDQWQWDEWQWHEACLGLGGGKLKTFCPVSCLCTESWVFELDENCPRDCQQ